VQESTPPRIAPKLPIAKATAGSQPKQPKQSAAATTYDENLEHYITSQDGKNEKRLTPWMKAFLRNLVPRKYGTNMKMGVRLNNGLPDAALLRELASVLITSVRDETGIDVRNFSAMASRPYTFTQPEEVRATMGLLYATVQATEAQMKVGQAPKHQAAAAALGYSLAAGVFSTEVLLSNGQTSKGTPGTGRSTSIMSFGGEQITFKTNADCCTAAWLAFVATRASPVGKPGTYFSAQEALLSYTTGIDEDSQRARLMSEWRATADEMVASCSPGLSADANTIAAIVLDTWSTRATTPKELKALVNQYNPYVLAHAGVKVKNSIWANASRCGKQQILALDSHLGLNGALHKHAISAMEGPNSLDLQAAKLVKLRIAESQREDDDSDDDDDDDDDEAGARAAGKKPKRFNWLGLRVSQLIQGRTYVLGDLFPWLPRWLGDYILELSPCPTFWWPKYWPSPMRFAALDSLVSSYVRTVLQPSRPPSSFPSFPAFPSVSGPPPPFMLPHLTVWSGLISRA
jgi:hypothetical protein